MLAKTSALGTLVSVKIGDRKPLKREVELAYLTCNKTCYGRSHFRANGKSSSASVSKVIGLLVGDLLAAFCNLHFKVFEHRTVIFFKCGKLKRLADFSKEPIAQTHIVGVKVTGTFIGLS